MRHAIALIAALLFAPLASLSAADPARPNVIIVMPDDMGYGETGCRPAYRATPAR